MAEWGTCKETVWPISKYPSGISSGGAGENQEYLNKIDSPRPVFCVPHECESEALPLC